MTLVDDVRRELLVMRKSDTGLSLGTMARSPKLTGLLGDGDAVLALNTLRTKLLELDHSLSIQAAMASLGLTAEGTTHLSRLDEFGEEHGYEQRQARRYSDKGIQELSQLISGHWVSVGLPHLNITLWQVAKSAFALRFTTRRLQFVEMRPPVVRIRTDDVERVVDLDMAMRVHGWHETSQLQAPIEVDVGQPTSLSIVWNGELWPKFSLTLVRGSERDVRLETVGAKALVRW